MLKYFTDNFVYNVQFFLQHTGLRKQVYTIYKTTATSPLIKSVVIKYK